MRRTWIVLLAALLVLPAVASTAGAEERDGPYAVILRDVAPDGATTVGQVNTFGWVMFDDDGRPFVHHDAVFRVTLNGQTLLETSPASGHDYDGVDPYQVVFPTTGTYEVSVEIPRRTGDGGEVTASFEGTVHAADTVGEQVEIDAPASAMAGERVKIGYAMTDAGGDEVPDTYATIRVRRAADGQEVFRVRTRAEDGAHDLAYVFPEEGSYDVVVTVSGRSGADAMRPATRTASTTVEVAEREMPAKPGVPTHPMENVVRDGRSDDGFAIYGTYDPYTAVGPFGRQRMSAVVVDEATGELATDVAFHATLTGPDGDVLFASSDLLERDGVLTVNVAEPQIGDYEMDVTAIRGDWTGTVELRYSVHPPTTAMGAGPQTARIQADETPTAGELVPLNVRLEDAAGGAHAHGEVDFRLVDRDTDRVIYTGKLHTHESGDFPLDVTFASPGEVRAELWPTPTVPAPTPTYRSPDGDAPTYVLSVDDGPGLESVDTGPDRPPGAPASVPGFGVVAAVLAGVAAWVLRRR